ncbi:PadR family transcriptional regulator [Allostreptomyces psammosilenae]|uniref:DNA-binding PadR family transcriptional regulator n=1 Tax=Allostreptomyces psammosilenae TaxID=1892865 RepID=A0A852ZYM7_9ACTN|nr:PadR family transcriptional regulator [Allostreptomyces psammosilenae]NYI06330.1 DNA-binding PadR family transcriptional regulator [Allostreptomyces psammosilenae]
MSPVFAHGRLRLYLLALLADEPRHGYELIRLLQERFQGLYAPSAGTVYPRLAKLEREGLVSHTVEGGRKVYAITEAGRRELRERSGELAEVEAEIRDSVAELAAEIAEDVRATARELREELDAAAREVRGRQPAGKEAGPGEAEPGDAEERPHGPHGGRGPWAGGWGPGPFGPGGPLGPGGPFGPGGPADPFGPNGPLGPRGPFWGGGGVPGGARNWRQAKEAAKRYARQQAEQVREEARRQAEEARRAGERHGHPGHGHPGHGHHEADQAREQAARIARDIQERMRQAREGGDWQRGLTEGLGELTRGLADLARGLGGGRGAQWPGVGDRGAAAGKEAGDAWADAVRNWERPDPDADPLRELERLLDRFRDEVRDAARDAGVTREQLDHARDLLATTVTGLRALLGGSPEDGRRDGREG